MTTKIKIDGPFAATLARTLHEPDCPNGAEASSPGLERSDYPGWTNKKSHQPQRGCIAAARERCNPFRVVVSFCGPKVARASQPWAEGWNPVGIQTAVSENA